MGLSLIYVTDPTTGKVTVQWGNIAAIAVLVVGTIWILRKTPLKSAV